MRDVAAYHEHCNTDAVVKYLGGTMSRSAVKHEVRWLKQQQVSNGHTFWAMERKRDCHCLGFTESFVLMSAISGWRES